MALDLYINLHQGARRLKSRISFIPSRPLAGSRSKSGNDRDRDQRPDFLQE